MMKTATTYRPRYPKVPYPNAATRRQVAQKWLDTLLVLVSSMGLALCLMLLALC